MFQWIPAILTLSVLIIIHEFGHYFFARRSGMLVQRFSVFGMGPVLFRLFTYKGCEYVISAFPFGAYVQIVGMESEETEEAMRAELQDKDKDKTSSSPGESKPEATQGYRNFRDSSFLARVMTLAGGPIANYTAAIFIAVALFLTAGMQQITGAKIQGFAAEHSALEAAGLRLGDQFVEIEGQTIRGPESVLRVQKAGQDHLGEKIDVTVLREGEEYQYCVQLNEQAPAMGVNIGAIASYESVHPGTAILEGIKYPFVQSKQQLTFLGQMIVGDRPGSLGGPVAIVSTMAAQAKDGFASFFMIAALISALLGLFNFLPIPALDGGRLVFVFFNAISPKKIPLRVEEQVHSYGMLLLLAFMVYATIGDVNRLGASKTHWDTEISHIRTEILDAELDQKGGPGGCPPE